MGDKYSPIIISAKQTLQTIQTIITATQQTIFLIGVEFPGCYNSPPPTEDLVPRSSTIWGRGGEEKRETTISTPPTRDTAPCRRRTSVKKISAKGRQRRKTKPSRRSRGRTTIQTDDQGKHSHSKREDTRKKD